MADANHAGTLMLRADLLPENEKQQAKELIEEYVQIRMEAVAETDEVNLHSVLERCYGCQVVNGQYEISYIF